MNDDDIGVRIRQVAARAQAEIPRQRPTRQFYDGVDQPAPIPRRFAVYGIAAAAAVVVAIVFGTVIVQNSDPAPIDFAGPPPPSAVDSIAEQLALDTAVAAAHGLTLGEPVVADDDTISLEDQPDLRPLKGDKTILGYLRSVDALAVPDATSYWVYGPDGETIRGVLDLVDGFIPIEDDPLPPESVPPPGE